MKKDILKFMLIVGVVITFYQTSDSQQQPQEMIDEIQIKGFRGGLAPDIPSTSQANNYLRDVKNYVFTKEDGLAIRKAFVTWNVADTSPNDSQIVEGLFGYYKGRTQELIAIMRNRSSLIDSGFNQIVKLNLTTGAITTDLYDFAYRRGTETKFLGSFWSIAHEDSIAYIANAHMEMLAYDGNKIYPYRPLGPGQPTVVVINNSNGNLGPGIYRYRYVYEDAGGGGGDGERTNFSSASFEVFCDGDQVRVGNLLRPFDETKFDIQLYRTKADGDTFFLVTTLSATADTFYVDNVGDGTLNNDSVPPHSFGWADPLRIIGDSIDDTTRLVDSLFAPGAMRGFMEDSSGLSAGLAFFTAVTTDPVDHQGDWLAYWIVYVDSNGFHSVPGPPALVIDSAWANTNADSGTFHVKFDTVPPIPKINSNIRSVLILKKFQAYGTSCEDCAASRPASWRNNDEDSVVADSIYHLFVIDSIDINHEPRSELSWIGPRYDSIGIWEDFWGAVLVVRSIEPDTNVTLPDTTQFKVASGFSYRPWEYSPIQAFKSYTGVTYYKADSGYNLPEYIAALDSAIFFKPGALAIYNGRLFATADAFDLNQVFYSQARENTSGAKVFALTNIMSFPTGDGDAFVMIVSVEDGVLLFKQGNLFSLRGSRAIDFRADKVFDTKGTIAPKSVAVSDRSVAWLHDEGVFVWSLSSSSPVKISLPLQSLFDSLGYSTLKWAAGMIVNEDYWLSVPSKDSTINDVTYIFDSERRAWLKFEGFGFQVGLQFDTERSYGDWHSKRYIFGGRNNKLTKYGYSVLDTIDGVGTGNADTIQTLIETKFFWDQQPGHRKIFYVDVLGEGTIDSAKMTILGNLRVNQYDTLATVYMENFNFDSNTSIRFGFEGQIARSMAVRFETFTGSKHIIKGLNIGYRDWDREDDG